MLDVLVLLSVGFLQWYSQDESFKIAVDAMCSMFVRWLLFELFKLKTDMLSRYKKKKKPGF